MNSIGTQQETMHRPGAPSEIDAALENAGLTVSDTVRMLEQVTAAAETIGPISSLKERLRRDGVAVDACELELALLQRAADVARPRLDHLPVTNAVKALMIAEFDHLAAVAPALLPQVNVGHDSFVSLCKVVTLRRFVAGQLHWERSGIPRSWVARAVLRGSFRIIPKIYRELGGRAPVVFGHLAWRRGLVLREREHLRSYYRIARSIELQPEARAYIGEAWFHSPDTHRVAPHLAWLNTAIVENGGLISVLGPAHSNSGVFTGSSERRRLHEAGTFKPTTAAVIWPREAMIDWARRHPELAS